MKNKEIFCFIFLKNSENIIYGKPDLIIDMFSRPQIVLRNNRWTGNQCESFSPAMKRG
jgi:hypothetical protein